MTIKLTPKQWLNTSLGVAGAYIVYLLASAADGIWNIPAQVNSVVLAALAVLVTVPAMMVAIDTRLARRDAAMLDAIRWLEPTQQLPLLKVVGSAAVASPDELDRYAEGLVDGLASRHPEGGTVTKIGNRKS